MLSKRVRARIYPRAVFDKRVRAPAYEPRRAGNVVLREYLGMPDESKVLKEAHEPQRVGDDASPQTASANQHAPDARQTRDYLLWHELVDVEARPRVVGQFGLQKVKPEGVGSVDYAAASQSSTFLYLGTSVFMHVQPTMYATAQYPNTIRYPAGLPE